MSKRIFLEAVWKVPVLRARAPAPGGYNDAVDDVTDATFQQEVLDAEEPVVVDFWAPWCGPCRAVDPIFEQLAAEHEGRVRFVKLNIDENLATAGAYGVLSIPTAILFEGGEERERVIGRLPALALRAGVGRVAHRRRRSPNGSRSTRSSHGIARRRAKISRASTASGAASSTRPSATNHSACSSRTTA